MTTDATTMGAERWPLQRLLWAAPVIAGALAVAHGFREPLAWAATQAQFTCDLIPKRCAFGQALAWAHVPVGRYAVFAVLSTALLAATGVAYAAVAARSALSRTPAGVLLLAALVGGYGVTVLAALNGYLDIPMALLAALCIAARGRLWAVGAATLAGVAMHEGYLLIFLPVALLPRLLEARGWRDTLGPLAVAVSAVAVAVLLALGRPLSPEQLPVVVATLQRRVDFGVDPAAILVMSRSLGDNLHMMAQLVRTPWWRGQALLGAAIVAPPGLLFVWAILGGLRGPWLARLLVLLAGFAPLSMNLIGFDTWRWSALCVPTMLLAAAAGCDKFGQLKVPALPVFAGVVLMLAPLPFLLPQPLSHNPHLSADVSRIIGAVD